MQVKPRHVAMITLLLCFLSAVGFAQNPIAVENQQPGTANWQLLRPGFFLADDVNQQIKGYASAQSVNKGGSLTFYVTVSPAQTYTIDIYRMGYYQGLGGRLMQSIPAASGIQQPTCPTDPTTGMIACNWSAGATITIPTTWTTGVYLAFLTNAAGFQNYVPFVVRDDASHSAILYQSSVNTSQAYNNYPNDNLTGKSLYDFNSNGANTVVGSKRAAKVSFDRPYSNAGDGQFLSWEVYTVQWMEQNGYDVSYSTDVDTHANGALLLNHKAFMAVGHSEYWSKPQRTAVETARDAGVNLAFISADSLDWQVRYEASPTTSVANRVLVCYKSQAIDPVQGPTTTVEWSNPFINLPEQTLVGVMFAAQTSASFTGAANYVVANSSNWVYAGTGLTDGASIPTLVGYEADHYNSAFPSPVSIPGTYVLLSISPAVDVNNGNAPITAHSSIYQAPGGAWVFASGSMDFGWGLSNPGFVDARIQMMLTNILNRFVAGRPTVLSQSPASGTTNVTPATSVSVTFNHPMLASTFTASTFSLTAAGSATSVPASIAVSGATATLTPSAPLAASTVYTATVAGTVTDTNGALLGTSVTWSFTTAAAPSFTMSASPAAVSLVAGNTATSQITITPQSGFTRAVTFSASGLPSGVTASFSPASSTSGSTVTFTATVSAAGGTTNVTITGTSGSLSNTAAISLTVAPAITSPYKVDMSSAFNVYGIFKNGTAVTHGGFDADGYAYSANLLGSSINAEGVIFALGAAGAPDAAANTTVALPPGKFKYLKFLGAGVNGNQYNQRFVVTYTDGTTATSYQSLSDWAAPVYCFGENIAIHMPYRLGLNTNYQGLPVNVYYYAIPLNNAKTVKSITLPANRNVVVLAITMQ